MGRDGAVNPIKAVDSLKKERAEGPREPGNGGVKGIRPEGALALLLLTTTVACQRTPQAIEPTPSLADSELAASELGSPATEPILTNGSDRFVGSLPGVPNGEAPTANRAAGASDLGLSAKYAGAARSSEREPKKVRPPRVVTAGRPNPFRSVNSPQVQVSYQEPATPATPDTQLVPPAPIAEEAAVVEASPGRELADAAPTPAIAFGSPAPSLVQPPTVVPTATLPAVPPTLLPVAAVPPVALPSLPMPSVPPVPPALPLAEVAAPPAPVPPTAIAESIEIKGLIQIGDRLNVIIKDPAASTSRTVQVGDIIGGGRVKLSRIDAVDTRDPQVVLEQDGVEIIRSIGV